MISGHENLKINSTETGTAAINEVQLLLAEKRTALAVMRTGIAVLALPMSILGLLVATSKYYNILHVLDLIVPLGLFSFLLIILGCYLVIRSIISMYQYDRLIYEIKRKYSIIADFID